jgi:hypothetical protein
MPEPWAFREICGAVLPHARYYSSLVRIAEGLASSCGSSFSAGCGHGGRQSARRLFRRRETTVEGILSGHYQQTAARCSEHALVLCAQDTTYLDFSSHTSTSGLGPLGSRDRPYARGLVAHSVLAVTPDGLPLGLLHVRLWAREERPLPETNQQTKRQANRKRPTSEKESVKWLEGLRAISQALPVDQDALLIQDREGDMFDLLAAPRRARLHLLIRACQPHNVELLDPELLDPELLDPGDEQGQANCSMTTMPTSKSTMMTAMKLMDAIEGAPVAGEMSVRVPRKPAGRGKQGQAEREVRLSVQYRTMRVMPPRHGLRHGLRHGRHDGARKPQTITVVRATEIDPPSGDEPICWVLLTTMMVQEAAAARQMVEYYARRWTIERLHYTLKSGCRAERLQIDDGHALQNALALYYLVAWHVMWLTHLARTQPDKPAQEVLQPEELQVLRAAAPKPVVTVRDALREIARLAGYEPYANGPPPGEKRIWQGLLYLQALTQGWSLAHGLAK